MGTKARSVLIIPALLLLLIGVTLVRWNVHAAATNRYQEVKGWPKLPPGMELGEVAGVAVDKNGHVFVFHRPGRGFDLTASEKLKQPTGLEIDDGTWKLLASWGADTFLV